MVHQNPPHHLRAYGEKVRAVIPSGVSLSYQAEISFVNQVPALPAMLGTLAAQALLRQAAKLGINQRRQLGARSLVALAPSSEQRRHIARCLAQRSAPLAFQPSDFSLLKRDSS
jgi:ABC-type hemin transport system ATPase subunit